MNRLAITLASLFLTSSFAFAQTGPGGTLTAAQVLASPAVLHTITGPCGSIQFTSRTQTPASVPALNRSFNGTTQPTVLFFSGLPGNLFQLDKSSAALTGSTITGYNTTSMGWHIEAELYAAGFRVVDIAWNPTTNWTNATAESAADSSPEDTGCPFGNTTGADPHLAVLNSYQYAATVANLMFATYGNTKPNSFAWGHSWGGMTVASFESPNSYVPLRRSVVISPVASDLLSGAQSTHNQLTPLCGKDSHHCGFNGGWNNAMQLCTVAGGCGPVDNWNFSGGVFNPATFCYGLFWGTPGTGNCVDHLTANPGDTATLVNNSMNGLWSAEGVTDLQSGTQCSGGPCGNDMLTMIGTNDWGEGADEAYAAERLAVNGAGSIFRFPGGNHDYDSWNSAAIGYSDAYLVSHVIAAFFQDTRPGVTVGSGGTIPINTELPQIVGLDTVGSTLAVKPGVWDGSASTKTYKWHTIGGSTLGTGLTFGPLSSAMVSACSSGADTSCGRIQVEETATNGAGSSTVISDYVGPVETALPSPPPIGPGTAPTSWPGPPENYLENGWAVYPGCDPPPVTPDTSDPTKVWYFDPVAGGTLSSGATGHAGSPFKDISAVFSAVVGYNPATVTGFVVQNHTAGPGGNQDQVRLSGTGMLNGIATVDGVLAANIPGSPFGDTLATIVVPLGHTVTSGNVVVYTPLWGSVINPGAVVYIKADPSGASVGSLNGNGYSTSDGTATGTVAGNWTWFLADPSSPTPPVLTGINRTASAGFLFDGINVEQNALTTSTFADPQLTLIGVIGSEALPSFDLAFRNMSVTSWMGHSNDPKNPSSYPTTGGHADGTILTAGPYWGPGDGNVAGAITISASGAGQTRLLLSSAPPNLSFVSGKQFYVHSPGYFLQQEEKNQLVLTPPSNTGIPNGSIIVDLQGSTSLTNRGQLTAATATEVNGGVSPTIAGTALTTTALPAGTLNDFYVVASAPTAFSLLYKCEVSAGCDAGSVVAGTGWTQLGSFLPATATLNDDWYMVNTSHLWTGNATPAWVDGGQAFIDIAACDPTANAATGCPTTDYPGIAHGAGSNVPECDPKVNPVGYTCTPVAWNGTTRAITSEGVFFSPRIQIIPAGWWNHVDWNYALNGIGVTGTLNSTSGNPDPANPNNLQGAYCISLSKNSVRWVRNEVSFSGVQDSIAYRNFMKYRSGDAFKRYSSHRVMIIGNFSADSSWQGRDHPDCVQDAQSFGPAGSHFYGNVDMDNECYTSVDPLDPFVNYTEGIFGTDQIYDGSYKANNVQISSNPSGPLGTTGMWDVVANNDALTDFSNTPGGIRELSGSKVGGGLAAHSLIANNVVQNLSRNNPFPTQPCENTTTTAENNIGLPVIDWGTGAVGVGDSTHCNTSDQMFNAAAPGAYPDINIWVAYDWRTEVSGANSPFNDIHLNPPPALPGAGAGVMASNSCLRNEWPVGTCNHGDVGRLDLRPSASFVPTTGTIKGNVGNITSLPKTGLTVNDEYIVTASVVCPSFGTNCTVGVTYPPGVYTYVGPGTADWTPQPPNPPVPYNPAIIGGGVNLGPQQPPADHARRPWAASPSVGAYELH